ncbi:MAG: glycerol kinase, partial [Alphaproteobacteria bacterium]|nr:glycerol kinase [Alphaproteobacteria bacterium]
HDVFKAMAAQSPAPLGRLFVDGGPSKNSFLMQCVADALAHPVIQCDAAEASALGAAYLAGLTLGLWDSPDAIKALPRKTATLDAKESDVSRRLMTWQDAIFRSTVSPTSSMGE